MYIEEKKWDDVIVMQILIWICSQMLMLMLQETQKWQDMLSTVCRRRLSWISSGQNSTCRYHFLQHCFDLIDILILYNLYVNAQFSVFPSDVQVLMDGGHWCEHQKLTYLSAFCSVSVQYWVVWGSLVLNVDGQTVRCWLVKFIIIGNCANIRNVAFSCILYNFILGPASTKWLCHAGSVPTEACMHHWRCQEWHLVNIAQYFLQMGMAEV